MMQCFSKINVQETKYKYALQFLASKEQVAVEEDFFPSGPRFIRLFENLFLHANLGHFSHSHSNKCERPVQ